MLGLIFFVLALLASGYLLVLIAREARPDAAKRKEITSLKNSQSAESTLPKKTINGVIEKLQDKQVLLRVIIVLALCAVFFATKYWPVGFMLLFASACIAAIEVFRGRIVDQFEQTMPSSEDRDRKEPAANQLEPGEARAVLGVEIGATESDIKQAHKTLISQLHPDHGGSDYLAAKINDARSVLLGELETPTIDKQ